MTAGRALVLVVLVSLAAIAGCMAAPPSVGHQAAHALLTAGIGVAALVGASFLLQAYRHHLLMNALKGLSREATVAGEPVELVPDLASPFVAGLWRPRIFCPDDLGSRLDPDELEAVILHERHHRLERAPLRMAALSALAPVVCRAAAGRAWLEREAGRLEIAADRYAIASGGRRPALARALLKLAPTDSGLAVAPGFASAAELRIRDLLGEPTGLDGPRPAAHALVAAVLVATCVMAYFS